MDLSVQTKPALDRPSLLALRWVGTGVMALALLLGAASWLPAPPLSVGIGVLVLAIGLNSLLHVKQELLGWVLLCDTALLTVMLASAGGVSNPFTLLYLLPVLVASLVLSPLWSGGLAVLTTLAFAGLYRVSPAHHHMDMSQHLLGMIAAYGATVPVLAIGVHRFRSATEAAETERRMARESRDAAERLASLAALAGGAAHELSTPLSTILLVARELGLDATGEVAEDLKLVGEEVLRCREILDELALDAAAPSAQWGEVPLKTFVTEALSHYKVSIEAGEGVLLGPTRLVAQALRRLVGNAKDAGASEVRIVVDVVGEHARFRVFDDGAGMSPETLARACEPFFTTKSNGQGRGLGLFFVHSLAHQLDGSFELESSSEGTTATLMLAGRG